MYSYSVRTGIDARRLCFCPGIQFRKSWCNWNNEKIKIGWSWNLRKKIDEWKRKISAVTGMYRFCIWFFYLAFKMYSKNVPTHPVQRRYIFQVHFERKVKKPSTFCVCTQFVLGFFTNDKKVLGFFTFFWELYFVSVCSFTVCMDVLHICI